MERDSELTHLSNEFILSFGLSLQCIDLSLQLCLSHFRYLLQPTKFTLKQPEQAGDTANKNKNLINTLRPEAGLLNTTRT